MSEVGDLLARIEAEHGPEVADVVRRSIEAGPPKRKGRPLYDGKRDPRRTGHALGGHGGGSGTHSAGPTTSASVRDGSGQGRN